MRVLGADPTRIDVAYHGVDHSLFHQPSPEQMRPVSDRLGLHGQPYVAYLGTPGAAQERARPDRRLGRGRGRPARPARPGAGRRQRLERRGGRGGRRGSRAPAPGPPRLPALHRPARVPRRSARRRLPQPGRGLRPAGAGGDGLRRPGADHAPHLAARGRRRRGRLHRAGRGQHPGRAARPCSTTRRAGRRWAPPGTPGRWSSPGPPRPRRTWRPTCVRPGSATGNLRSHVITAGHP